jgi:hypothetical protein
MKKFFKLFAIVAGILAMMACSKTEIFIVDRYDGYVVNPYWGYTYVPQNSAGDYGIVFGNYAPGTKATSNGGVLVGPGACGYDSFDVYAYKNGTDAIMNPYTVTWDESTSSWTYVNGTQELQYFDRNSTNYDFIGVISDKASAYNAGNVEILEVESFLDNSDELTTPGELLWSGTQVAKANYANPVQLTFNHANAKMYIGFASDRNDTEIVDYVPGNPGSPAIPGTPDTETYTSKSTQFIDELVAGGMAQVCIGFVGANSPKLTAGNPTTLYVGVNNATYNFYAKDWLLSIKDAVNSQFVYYRLDQVANSTSKTETTEDWESASSNKNIFMMKLADGVNATDFANGNDAFWSALVAHDEGTADPWFGGSPAVSFKSIFQKAYDEGWRVIRINVSDTNANQVLVFLANNSNTTTQVCTITPGTPDIPAVPATAGLEGIRVFSVDADPVDGKFIVADYTTKANASISTSDCVLTVAEADDEVLEFGKPSGAVSYFATYSDVVVANSTFSPTTFYALPVANPAEGYVIKFSYTYNGVTYYDARVNLPAADTDFAQGYYYKYVIYITSNTNGTTDPNEADADKDEVDTSKSPIKFNVTVATYGQGVEKTYQL